MMMRGCMDTVEIEQSAGGTTLLLDRTLRREPVVSPAFVAAVSGTPPRPATLSVVRTETTQPRVALGGPVDLSTADELRRELWSASRGGALPLVVELGGVTHLASAGIQVLYDFAEDMAADGRGLRFVVPAGSPARQALALSDLPRIVTVTES
jgi:anti-anti-sigma factor